MEAFFGFLQLFSELGLVSWCIDIDSHGGHSRRDASGWCDGQLIEVVIGVRMSFRGGWNEQIGHGVVCFESLRHALAEENTRAYVV